MSHLLFERQMTTCGVPGVFLDTVDDFLCSCIVQAFGSCTVGTETQVLACLCPSLANWASSIGSCGASDPSIASVDASALLSLLSPTCSSLTAPATTAATTTKSSTLPITESSASSTASPTSLSVSSTASPPSLTVSSTAPLTSSTLSSTTGTSYSQSSSPSSQSIPEQNFVSNSTAVESSTSSSTHSPILPWNGSGPLLVGYCTTPQYALFDGATVLWAPVIGCVDGKPDCCPYTVQTTTATVTDVVSTVTIDIGSSTQGSQSIQGEQAGPLAFPAASNPAQATLARCPEDYQSISDGCCPSGYQLWNAALGGETPCFTTLQNPLTPPPIPDSLVLLAPTGTAANTTTSLEPISAVVNVVYAMYFPASPAPTPLPTPAKIGIGIGSAIAGLVVGSLLFFLFWMRRRYRRELRRERDSAVNRTSEIESWRSQTMPPTTMTSSSVAQPIGPLSNSNVGYVQPQPHVAFTQAYYEPAASPPFSWDGSGHMVSPSTTEGTMLAGGPRELLDPQWPGRHELQAPE